MDNDISKIEGLEKLVKVIVLNLDYNKFTKIEGLDKLKSLKALRVRTIVDVEENYYKKFKKI